MSGGDGDSGGTDGGEKNPPMLKSPVDEAQKKRPKMGR